MNLTPSWAQFWQVLGQHFADAVHIFPGETVALTEFRRSVGAVENEHGFTVSSDHVDMGWAVIVRVDHHPVAIEAENSRHSLHIAKTQALGNNLMKGHPRPYFFRR
jgi:hypothetical protein